MMRLILAIAIALSFCASGCSVIRCTVDQEVFGKRSCFA